MLSSFQWRKLNSKWTPLYSDVRCTCLRVCNCVLYAPATTAPNYKVRYWKFNELHSKFKWKTGERLSFLNRYFNSKIDIKLWLFTCTVWTRWWSRISSCPNSTCEQSVLNYNKLLILVASHKRLYLWFHRQSLFLQLFFKHPCLWSAIIIELSMLKIPWFLFLADSCYNRNRINSPRLIPHTVQFHPIRKSRGR